MTKHKIYLILALIISVVSLFSLHAKNVSASSGSFTFYVTYSKASIAWNFINASTISVNQGEWALVQINSNWNLSSGCFPGADAPRCIPPESLGAANTTVIWKQNTCPAGASCYWYSRDGSNPYQLTWGIVPNFNYTPQVMINTGSLAPGTYPIVFSVEEHPNACAQSGGSCIPPKSFTANLVVAPPLKPTISAYPANINFAGYSGGSAPAGNYATLKNTGNATLNWNASTNQSWCHIGSTSGSLAPGNEVPLMVSVDAPSNVGTFTCNITFSDPNATNNPQTVTVTYSVTSSVPPTASGDPAAPILTSISPSQATLSQVQSQITMNVYGSQFNPELTYNLPIFTRDADGQQTGISAISFISGGLKIWVPANLVAGTYTVQILNAVDFMRLRSNGLAFTVLPNQAPTISLSSSAFSFSGVSGGSAPPSQSLTIRNTGTGTLNWTGTTNQSWCRINGRNNTSSVSGTVAPGGLVTASISVDAPSNAGTFYCIVSISDPNATNNPQNIVVTYTVSAVPKPTVSLSITNLTFQGTSGGSTPGIQSLTIRNTGTGTLNWTGTTNQSWCHISPASGSINPGGTATVNVSVDTPSNVGLFTCTISIFDPNATNSPQSVTVTYHVDFATIGNPSNVTALANDCNSITLTWTAGSNASSYRIYRSINATIPAVPYVISYTGTSYTDIGVSVNSLYYYWIESVGGNGQKIPAASNGSGGIALQGCQTTTQPPSGSPDLAASDKNLREINSVIQPNQDCDYNQFQGLPSQGSLKEGDVLTFEINLCNLTGTADAQGVVVTDQLTNFDQPSTGWGAAINGSPLQYVYTTPVQGQYAYDSVSNKLTFNIDQVAKGTAKQITYKVRVKSQSQQATVCPKCQNKAAISFTNPNQSGPSQIQLSTPAIFYKSNP